jgi:hypothetical protein
MTDEDLAKVAALFAKGAWLAVALVVAVIVLDEGAQRALRWWRATHSVPITDCVRAADYPFVTDARSDRESFATYLCTLGVR